MTKIRPIDYSGHIGTQPAPPKGRRLIVRLRDGEDIRVGPHHQISLTAVPHADTRVPITAVVQQECDLGCWHDVSTTDLPCWGSA